MKLNPQPKPVRIRLSIEQQNGNGRIVYFGLDDLLRNFHFESLLPHILDKSLMRWLNQIRYEDISAKIEQIIGADISEQLVERNKYSIISILFNEVILDNISSDKEFLTCLLKMSGDYKSSVKNILESESFTKYSEFEFLSSLAQGCDFAFKKILEEHLALLQRAEDWRKEKERAQKEQEEINHKQVNKQVKKAHLGTTSSVGKTQHIIVCPDDDYVVLVNCVENELVHKGDRLFVLDHDTIIAPCNGSISRIGVTGRQYVQKGCLLAVISTDVKNNPIQSSTKLFISKCKNSYKCGESYPIPQNTEERYIKRIFSSLSANYNNLSNVDPFDVTLPFDMPESISDPKCASKYEGHHRILRFIMQTLRNRSVDTSLINGTNGYACHYIYNTFTSLNGYFPSNHKFGITKAHKVAYKQWFRTCLDYISENFEKL